jgi:hypothetical protein
MKTKDYGYKYLPNPAGFHDIYSAFVDGISGPQKKGKHSYQNDSGERVSISLQSPKPDR